MSARNECSLTPLTASFEKFSLLPQYLFIQLSPTGNELGEKDDAALSAKPVIRSGSAASTQVFFGSERATPQAFSASGRRCLRERCGSKTGYQTRAAPGTAGAKDHTRRGGTHGWLVRPAATRVPARQQLTFRIREKEGRGAQDPRSIGHFPLPPGLPHAARASRAGSLPPEECGERLG